MSENAHEALSEISRRALTAEARVRELEERLAVELAGKQRIAEQLDCVDEPRWKWITLAISDLQSKAAAVAVQPPAEPALVLIAEVKRLAYEMSKQDVESITDDPGKATRNAIVRANATATAFEAAVDRLAAAAVQPPVLPPEHLNDRDIEMLAADFIAEDWLSDRYYRDMNLVAFARAIEAKVRGTGSVPPSANLDSVKEAKS